MTVYVISYYFDTEDKTETSVEGAYRDYSEACSALHERMNAIRKDVLQYHPDGFDDDFESNDENRVSFGYYDRGWINCCVWQGEVTSMEVK